MKLSLACFVLVCLAISAFAQESPKSELFGGYSYLRTDEGDIDLMQLAGVVGTGVREGANLHGFNIAATYNIQKSWGFVADFGGGTYDGVGAKSSHVRGDGYVQPCCALRSSRQSRQRHKVRQAFSLIKFQGIR